MPNKQTMQTAPPASTNQARNQATKQPIDQPIQPNKTQKRGHPTEDPGAEPASEECPASKSLRSHIPTTSAESTNQCSINKAWENAIWDKTVALQGSLLIYSISFVFWSYSFFLLLTLFLPTVHNLTYGNLQLNTEWRIERSSPLHRLQPGKYSVSNNNMLAISIVRILTANLIHQGKTGEVVASQERFVLTGGSTPLVVFGIWGWPIGITSFWDMAKKW